MVNQTKFTMNAFLLIVTLASALYLFISVGIYDMAYPWARNEAYPIEGTPYVVKYISHRTDDESGIYAGIEAWEPLKLRGVYGYDWGAAVSGDQLFCNEYHRTRLGFQVCDLVRIDLNTFEKTKLYPNTMLIGRCPSGELVCMGECLDAGWFSASNAFYTLYALSWPRMSIETKSAYVRYIDPSTSEMVFEQWDDDALTAFRQRYLLETPLAEVAR